MTYLLIRHGRFDLKGFSLFKQYWKLWAEQEVVEVAQDTVIFSPSGRPLLDQDEPSPANTPFNPKRKLTFSSPGNTQPTSGAAASTQGAETSASTRPPTKRLRQATLTGKPTPAARQAGEIFNTPAQPSAWFTANYTGPENTSNLRNFLKQAINKHKNHITRSSYPPRGRLQNTEP